MEDSKRFAAGVFPRGCPEGRSQLHMECLVEGHDPGLSVVVRMRQAIERRVLDRQGEPVPSLVVAGTRYASHEEAAEHEVRIPSLPGRTARIVTAGEERAELVENDVRAGALVWSWEPLHATIEAWVEEIEPELRRVQVSIANRLEWDSCKSGQRPRRAFYSTEVIVHTPDGAFASLVRPPRHLSRHSAACHNEGLWPVVVGEAGDRRTILASQIPLADYARPAAGARSIAFGVGVATAERATTARTFHAA